MGMLHIMISAMPGFQFGRMGYKNMGEYSELGCWMTFHHGNLECGQGARDSIMVTLDGDSG